MDETRDPDPNGEVGKMGVHVLTLEMISQRKTENDAFLCNKVGETATEVRLFPDTRSLVDGHEGTWSSDEEWVTVSWGGEQEECTDQTQKIARDILRAGFQHMPLPAASVTDPKVECKKWLLLSRDTNTHLVFLYKSV